MAKQFSLDTSPVAHDSGLPWLCVQAKHVLVVF